MFKTNCPWPCKKISRPKPQGQGQGQGLEAQGQGQGQGLEAQGQGQGHSFMALRPGQGQGQGQGLTSLLKFIKDYLSKGVSSLSHQFQYRYKHHCNKHVCEISNQMTDIAQESAQKFKIILSIRLV